MDHQDEHLVSRNYKNEEVSEEEMSDLRRGPWTVEEDFTLMNYIAHNGEGRWNSLARCAGLKRTGKSCRLRWLNYLRPDVRRGNITLEEQLLILELHSRWGNRWSKIAQHLPGRTDNEIKNYWRTRVQKHAKQLKCDVNSKQFKDTMRYLWMPRLVERIQAAAVSSGPTSSAIPSSSSAPYDQLNVNTQNLEIGSAQYMQLPQPNMVGQAQVQSYTPDNSSAAASSESFGTQGSDLTEGNYNNYGAVNYYPSVNNNNGNNQGVGNYGEQCLTSPSGYFNQGMDFMDHQSSTTQWMDGGDVSDSLWNVDDMWFLQHQFNNTSNV